LARNEYHRAYRELRLASQRQPSNELLKRDVSIAWVEHSREVAVDGQNKRKQLGAGEQDVIEQYRVLAQRYKQQNKLDEALAKIAEAEKIDADSLPVLLAKAEILSARNELVKALATLDRYDQLAVDKERERGNTLRNEVVFQITDGLDTARKKLAEAWSAGRYHQTAEIARQALLLDDKDATVLYYMGIASMATRQAKEGAAFLNKYLEVSNNLDADVPKRRAVARILTGGVSPAAGLPEEPVDGDPNWFSGRRLPPGALYDPLSGMFSPRIDQISASNKMTVKFQWEGDRLKSIVPVFEKAQQATGEKPFVFAYAEGVPHVAAVDAGETPRKLPRDPDGVLRESNVILPNNPLVDARAVERLGGKMQTVGVAGNRYFFPFVWERPYFFALAYDAQGRLRTARQIADAESRATGLVELEFEWNGMRLSAIRGYSLSDSGVRGAQLYTRSMTYAQDKLMGEEIRAGQKDSKVKYLWNGGALVSAECDKDETLDNRSRTVTFAVAGGGRVRGK
jgi:tetratricopeptide (TPR) repeat protein